MQKSSGIVSHIISYFKQSIKMQGIYINFSLVYDRIKSVKFEDSKPKERQKNKKKRKIKCIYAPLTEIMKLSCL